MSRINVTTNPANCRTVPILSLYPKLLPIAAGYDLLSPKEYNFYTTPLPNPLKSIGNWDMGIYIVVDGGIGGTTFKIYAIIVIFMKMREKKSKDEF